jgi:2-polyprenyl-3-methyl-5-hydroxy-6-metoxy-1,4-benzoquinol methylase
VTLLDVSAASLEFARECARKLDVEVRTIRADATLALPFPEGSFDCVWSSGLLEHFEFSERVEMISSWSRVCRGRLVSIVPNAASVAYRMGKRLLEESGEWPYGLEMPLSSLRRDYEAAGLVVTEELTVGAEHGLEFLPADHPIRRALAAWIGRYGEDDLTSWSQGYLLITVGHRE